MCEYVLLEKGIKNNAVEKFLILKNGMCNGTKYT